MIWFRVRLFSPDCVEFSYVEKEGSFGPIFRPYLPVTLSYGKRRFPVGNALVDTGSDMTILPLEIAHVLEIELDDSRAIKIQSAGGGEFEALPSQKKIGYALEMKSFRPMRWQDRKSTRLNSSH